MFTPTKLSTAIALSAILSITACGGGGGSSSNSETTNDDFTPENNGNNGNNGNTGDSNNSDFNTVVPEKSLALTQDNATEVAFHIARLVLDVEDLVSAINISVLDNAASNKSAYTKPLSQENTSFRRLSTVGVCETGSVSTNKDGDARFNDCEYSNSLYNGDVELDLVFSGIPSVGGDFSYAGDGVADNFTLKQGSRKVRIDGAFDISNGSRSDTETPGASSMTIDGVVNDRPLYINENGETTRIAGNYSMTYSASTETTSPIFYNQDIDGRVASTLLGGQVTVFSDIFTGHDNNFPHSGELTIVGAAASTVLLTVIDDTMVQVSVDANGDDDFDDFEDSQEIMSWFEFLRL